MSSFGVLPACFVTLIIERVKNVSSFGVLPACFVTLVIERVKLWCFACVFCHSDNRTCQALVFCLRVLSL